MTAASFGITFDSIQVLIPIFLAVVLGRFSFYSIRDIRFGYASTHWRRTEGVVINAFFSEHPEADGGDMILPNVLYRYVVAGKSYDSETFSYGGANYSSLSNATEVLRGIHKGKTVDVYYDPAEPARAVLVPGSGVGNTVAVLLCAGGWIALLSWVLRANGEYLT